MQKPEGPEPEVLKCRACLSTEERLVPFDNTSIESYNLLTSLNAISKSNAGIKLESVKTIDDDDIGADSFMGANDEPSLDGEDVPQVKNEDVDQYMDQDEMEDSKWDNITELPEGLINDIELCDAVFKFDDTSESETDDESGDEQNKVLNEKSNKQEIKNRHMYQLTSATWEVKEFPIIEHRVLQPSYRPNVAVDFAILNYFQQYINDEFIATIVTRTNRSHLAVHGQQLNLSSEEFHKYLGMTFIMASIKNLSLKEFWEHPFGIPIIRNTMSRHRYVTIRNSVELISHEDVTDEELKDNLWKVRPLIDRIQRGCRLQEKEQHLSVDEMIIPFSGTAPIKEYRPNERNPIGLKAYIMSNPDGLVTDLEIFHGNSTFPNLKGTDFAVREKAVLSMADSLVPGHVLYFDRYFTTEKLATELANRGIGCTGVLRKTAIPINAKGKLLSDEKLKKNGKGAVQYLVNDTNNIAITKWFDKKVTTFMSTVEANDPIDKYERWSSNLYKNVYVNRPAVARNYQKYIEGSEIIADTLSEFPNKHRSKSCMLRFFYHILDLAVCNSWLQYNKVEIEKGTPVKKIKEFQAFKMALGGILITGEVESDESDEFSSSDESTSGGDDIPIFELGRNNKIIKLIEPKH